MEMMALMSTSEASDVQTQMAAQLTRLLDSAATEPAKETDMSEGVSMRPRRISNPRPMEAPGGASWEYPLSKEEKKARVVLISSAEIESLEEEVARLTLDP